MIKHAGGCFLTAFPGCGDNYCDCGAVKIQKDASTPLGPADSILYPRPPQAYTDWCAWRDGV